MVHLLWLCVCLVFVPAVAALVEFPVYRMVQYSVQTTENVPEPLDMDLDAPETRAQPVTTMFGPSHAIFGLMAVVPRPEDDDKMDRQSALNRDVALLPLEAATLTRLSKLIDGRRLGAVLIMVPPQVLILFAVVTPESSCGYSSGREPMLILSPSLPWLPGSGTHQCTSPQKRRTSGSCTPTSKLD